MSTHTACARYVTCTLCSCRLGGSLDVLFLVLGHPETLFLSPTKGLDLLPPLPSPSE